MIAFTRDLKPAAFFYFHGDSSGVRLWGTCAADVYPESIVKSFAGAVLENVTDLMVCKLTTIDADPPDLHKRRFGSHTYMVGTAADSLALEGSLRGELVHHLPHQTPMQMNERDTRFYLKQSTAANAGLGVFARVPLAKGDCLEVIGVRVQPGSVADQCSAFADRHKFVHAGQLIIPLGYAGMVNHSREPNMVRHEADGKLFLKALRDIAVDEELFHPYNETALRKMGLASRPASEIA